MAEGSYHLLHAAFQMKTGKAYRILVVDDEPMVRKSLILLLKHRGHEVHAEASGMDALLLLEQTRFDLIITDYLLGGMNGDQLTARIKDKYPHLPVILISAFAVEFSRGKSSGGADLVLEKPFSWSALADAMAMVLALPKK